MRYSVFVAGWVGLVVAVYFGSQSLEDVESGASLVDWLQDQYAYVLFWLVVMQAGVAASASQLPQRQRSGFRWFVALFCASLALWFPIVGGWKDFDVAYGAFVAGVLVVAVMDATVGDAWVDYTPHENPRLSAGDDLGVVPAENLQALYVHICRAVRSPSPNSREVVRFARSARSNANVEAKVGPVRLEVKPLTPGLFAVRLGGKLSREQRHRIELVIAILGNPTTDPGAFDRVRVRATRP